jgi:Putative ATP-dependent Lon protease
MKSQQVVLHDMLEKRYSLRPYGWPEDEVLLLLARLIVLGEVNLMMDASLLPIDKVYEAIAIPAKRRKVVVRKRETADPKSIQDARSLGKELFAEMGPDGEDALFTHLQAKLKEWQVALNGYRQLADTGNYPGGTEIGEALSLIGPLLADTDSRKFVERFNGLKSDLLEVGEQFSDSQVLDSGLDDLLNRNFPGKVVRKDLTKLVKEGANVPVYVLECLLGSYCASNDEVVIAEGLRTVKKILAENYVRPDEAEKVKSTIRERGSLKVSVAIPSTYLTEGDCGHGYTASAPRSQIPIKS